MIELKSITQAELAGVVCFFISKIKIKKIPLRYL